MNNESRSNISESFQKVPRVSSTHNRHYYDMLDDLSRLIDFNNPIFSGSGLRGRSLGSVQTVLVEMALQNEDILNNLKKYMIFNGKDWTPVKFYGMRKY